ncbi:MAG: Holliday junction branch migration protein RuvA [Spirochaetaceae bacterium]|nr:Holliday junction branch migration protein RuvA [Spirochaetaceae bacterium]MDT8299074.1 Holliday junction branch migration protein RuvA [Spirochaetaceae bacterium]
MVNSIRGILTFKSPEQVGIETGGVEWALDATSTTLSALPSRGEIVRVFTHLHHTQDQMKMYGFATREERTVFLALITVNGVGPSLARKILSGTTPDRFMAALDAEDLSTLGSIPGLGKKTAQKIVLQLRGKLADENEETLPTESGEVIDALKAMGFDGKGAGKAVAAILELPEVAVLEGEAKEKEILRRAIIDMSS